MLIKYLIPLLLFSGSIVLPVTKLWCQQDSIKKNRIDSLLMKRKGFLKQLAQNLIADTNRVNVKGYERNDLPFETYQNRIIRRITVVSVSFGVSINDTSKRFQNFLTNLSDHLHHRSRDFVINNNLFFKENQKLSPYLLGNNERYLRDLPYLQEARIVVEPITGTEDSVDILVLTKDVLSLGGSADVRSSQSVAVTAREDNFAGWGDRLQFQSLFDNTRNNRFGFGGEYIRRNLAGTFIDIDGGFLNYNRSFNTGRPEEQAYFIRFIRPLVNPYMKWTYAFSAESHNTDNMYWGDSLYKSDIKYNYSVYDGWVAMNLSHKNIGSENEFARLRWLVGLRGISQRYLDKPDKFNGILYYSYADLDAILASASIFKLNFYKTQYIYGFGRNEDLPEGLEASITTGLTSKNGITRPYGAISVQRYYFMKRKAYFNSTLKVGSYLNNKKLQDINLLGSIDYYSRLHTLTRRWKQREFLSGSISKQINYFLEEPLRVESMYGLD
ncbi:MAG TPA: hypothetical protein VFQ58_02790, partial [Flavisolibacter sp.]|nr:hypothetical protein [Flavisolibacter sp.]